jgi:hypothetical protein
MKLAKDLAKKEIEEYIKEYEQGWNTPDGVKDRETFEKINEALFRNGFLNSKQLYEVARWKTVRVSKIVKKNPDSMVKSITAFALKISDEKYKIRILSSLDGIGIPRASAILAMSDPEKYGVIDINAWLALTGEKKQSFDDSDWIWYLKQIRKLAKKHRKTPRQIDMVLMKYGQRLMKRRRKKHGY